MSAHVMDKSDMDLMVAAALHAYPAGRPGEGRWFQWWRTDDAGNFDGWMILHPGAEQMEGDEDRCFLTPSMVGQMLVSENVASVSYRYSEPGRTNYYGAEHAAEMTDDTIETLPGPVDRYYMGPYMFTDPRREITPGMVFGLIDRYSYQSCEHPEWRASEAYALCVALREAYCRRVIDAEHEAVGIA